MLYVPGVGEVPISISGNPNQPESLIHTTRAVGSVTNAMRGLKTGDYLGVRGPFGTQWPVDKAMGDDVVRHWVSPVAPGHVRYIGEKSQVRKRGFVIRRQNTGRYSLSKRNHELALHGSTWMFM